MKYAILNGWTARRLLFTLLGLGLTTQAAFHHDWVGVFLGLYFAGMGFMNAGCAAGYCLTENIKNGK